MCAAAVSSNAVRRNESPRRTFLSSAEARGLSDVVEAFRRTLELAELEPRLAALEREIANDARYAE